MQGSLWKSKYSDPSKNILPLFLYFDDFECRNALSSRSGEEKLEGIYVILACLPPHLIAKSKHIFLSTLVHSKYHSSFGNSAIF